MASNNTERGSTSGGFKFFAMLLFLVLAVGGYMLLSNMNVCDNDTSIVIPDVDYGSVNNGSSPAAGFELSYDGSATCSVEEMMLRALGDFKGLYEEKGYEYELYENGAVIVSCSLMDEVVEIPSELGGKAVVCIGEFGMYESSELSYTTKRTAFKGNSYIKKIVVPSSVWVTGTYCFADMHNLEELVLPNTLKYYFASAIGTPWFENQTNEFCTVGDGILIKYNGIGDEVVIPAGIKVISQWAMAANPLYAMTVPEINSLILPTTLTYISDNAIEMGASVLSLTIPDSVKFIGNFAIDLSESAYTLAVLDIGSGVKCANQRSFGFDSVWPSAISAFSKDFVIIGDGVLIKCNAENITEIPTNVRVITCSLGNVESIKIPANVQFIGANALSSATEVTFSEGLQMVGVMAFNNSKIKTVELPSSVWYIGVGGFANCTSLTKASLKSVKYMSPIAFFNNAVLGEVDLGSELSYIGKQAFALSGVSQMTLPESVKLIDNETFYGCAFLERVNVSAMDTALGESVFFGSDSAVLYCPKGSKTHVQAAEKDIKFIAE